MSLDGNESEPLNPSALEPKPRSNMRTQAATGLLWTFLGRFGQQLILFVVGLILARMLGPDEYGLVAMLTLFLALANLFADGGFGKSLIQNKNSDDLDASSMFYFNLLAAVASYGMIWLVAPWVSEFYARPELTGLLRTLGLGVLASAFTVVQSCLLTKDLRFRQLLVANWTATIGSGIVGIVLAWRGMGALAIVWQQVAMHMIRAAVLWWRSSWRPQWRFSWPRLQAMLPFGARLFAASAIDTVFQHLYVMVIGKFYDSGQAGLFHRAHSLQHLPVGNYLAAVNQVSFPLLSRIKDQPEALRRMLRKSVTFAAMTMGFLMFYLISAATPLTYVLLGSKWLPSAPYLQVMCIAGIILSLQATNVNAFQAVGRSDVVLRFQIIRKVVVALILAITITQGVMAIIWGQVVALALNFVVCGIFSRQLFGYGTGLQARHAIPYLGINAAACGLGWAAVRQWPPNPYVELVVQTLVCLIIFGGLHFWLRLEAFRDVLELARPHLRRLGIRA